MFKYLALLLLTLSANHSTQNRNSEITDVFVERIVNSLKFDNDGVQGNAIDLAEKYMITDAAPALEDILLFEENESLRLKAANVLFRFGGRDRIMLLAFAGKFDESMNVRSACMELAKKLSLKQKFERTKDGLVPSSVLGIQRSLPKILRR